MRTQTRRNGHTADETLPLETLAEPGAEIGEPGEGEQEVVVPVKGKGRGRKPQTEEIVIPPLKLHIIELTVKGQTPLIVNRFSEKAKTQMRDKQMGKSRDKKAPKNPVEDFLGSLYEMDGKKVTETKKGGDVYAKGRFGFPANSFRLAMVSACRFVDGLPMTRAMGAFRVIGESPSGLVEILDAGGKKPCLPKMREDMVRLNSGPKPVADVRYRAEFTEWSVKLKIRYNERAINPEQLAHLLNLAGFSVGVGEWRPEKRGDCGTFEVA